MPADFTPESIFIPVPDGRIHTLQWGAGPLLLFHHATGMCARAYLDLLLPLGEDFRVIAADARGHGQTELPVDPDRIPRDWKIYRHDIIHLIEALGGGPVRLAGHSFGATSSFEAAARTPGLASSICLIDPPFVPFAMAAEHRAMRDSGAHIPIAMAEQAARRRSHFDSREVAHDRYHGRGVFHDWPDSAFADYIAGALVPDEDLMQLACPPVVEANVYRGVSTTLEDSMAMAKLPITLLAASRDSTVGKADEARIRQLQPEAEIHRIPDTGHFLPITHPQLIRPWLQKLR